MYFQSTDITAQCAFCRFCSFLPLDTAALKRSLAMATPRTNSRMSVINQYLAAPLSLGGARKHAKGAWDINLGPFAFLVIFDFEPLFFGPFWYFYVFLSRLQAP